MNTESTTTTRKVTLRKIGSPDYGHVSTACTCGWESVWYSRRTVEGYRLARRDASQHICKARQRSTDA